MKNLLKIISLIILSVCFLGLIVRHDIPDSEFIEYARLYPQICHLPMGEAALIDSSWIITAGHVGKDVVRDKNEGKNPKVKCNGKEYSIERVIVHPDFIPIEEGLQNDIALIKIGGSINDITPAKIYNRSDEKGMQITLVGMGDTGNGLTGPQKGNTITRAATNKIDDVSDQWIYFTFDSPEAVNTTRLEGISGPGDSGGPAFAEISGERYIVGISSNQSGQSKYGRGRYGVMEYYTRVSTYKAWIIETMKKN